MIKSYYEFINESIINEKEKNPFYIDSDLEMILNSISSENTTSGRIAKLILALNYRNINTKISFVKLSNTKEYLSCLNAKDITDKNDNYSSDSFIDKYKNKFFEIKIGRLTNQIIELYNYVLKELGKDTIKLSSSDIEEFVNSFKSKYDYIKRNAKKNIKIVSGKEITHYYNEKNYAKKHGQLAYSCMRYEECENLFSIYETNKTINLAVMLDDNEKVLGRALLFELVNGQKFMDRIYTSDDSDVLVFIEWAKENKFLFKEKQNSSSYTRVMSPLNNYKEGIDTRLNVKVNKYNITYKKLYTFPYLDTLKYLYWKEGILSNMDDEKYGVYVLLEDGDGRPLCNKCEGSGMIECPECDGFDGCDKCEEGNIPCTRCGGFSYDY